MDSGFADSTTSSRDRLTPANPEAEQAVLGSILIDPDAVIRVAAFLKADDFYQEKNGWIYQAILDLHERREPADFLTVTDELDRRRQLDEVGGPAYVMDLINAVPTAIHVEHYARIVERTSVLRKLIRAAGQIAQIAYEETTEDIGEVVDRAEQIVFSVAERRAQRDLVAVRALMGDVVDRIDFLYHHRGEILGVPTGFKLLDKMLGGLQKSDLVILAARPGVGKCIVSGSRLLDPHSGRLVTIDEMVQARSGHLVTMDADLHLQPALPADFVDDGIKPVYRVQTALGRELTTTLSHPFFTIDGWKPLKDLTVGARIAVPRALPFFGAKELPEGHVKALAYLIADGCLTHTCPQFTNANPVLRNDFIEAVSSFPGVTTRIETSRGTRTPSVYVVGDLDFIREHRQTFAERVRTEMNAQSLSKKQLSSQVGVSPTLVHHWTIAKSVPNAASFVQLCDELAVPAEHLAPMGLPSISKNGKNSLTVWLQGLGLWGKTAHAKRVPAPVFELTRRQIALFLNRLFACDGSIFVSGEGAPRLSYATVSLELARDVQHLLLRFGLLAKLRHRKVRYNGQLRPAYELVILDRRSIQRFIEEIGIFSKEEKAEQARKLCLGVGSNPNLDTIPIEVWSRVLAAKGQRSWRSVYPQLGYPLESNFHVHRRALGRQRLAALAGLFEDQELENLATSDLYWDTIESIEYVGEHQVFDLTVEGTHNFVAEDMLVHNTSLAISLAQNAARKYGKRVAVFSLEMSNEQLVQRMLSAETGIDSQRLRLGDIQGEDEWHKLMEAAGALSDAPIFIDDTPAVSAMELRTKARRLYAEHDLDLIVVDYLQLMQGDRRSENRVQEISAISRGLKGLARELNVPVLALSQLSRAVESRQDKRPILSDLRESGGIEQDADVVMFIYREEMYNDETDRQNIADVIIAKHRNGPTGSVSLFFRKELTQFRDLELRREELE